MTPVAGVNVEDSGARRRRRIVDEPVLRSELLQEEILVVRNLLCLCPVLGLVVLDPHVLGDAGDGRDRVAVDLVITLGINELTLANALDVFHATGVLPANERPDQFVFVIQSSEDRSLRGQGERFDLLGINSGIADGRTAGLE